MGFLYRDTVKLAGYKGYVSLDTGCDFHSNQNEAARLESGTLAYHMVKGGLNEELAYGTVACCHHVDDKLGQRSDCKMGMGQDNLGCRSSMIGVLLMDVGLMVVALADIDSVEGMALMATERSGPFPLGEEG